MRVEDRVFFGNTNPLELVEQYGSPLYVYNESILRKRCQEMKALVSYPNFKVNYSAKANSNLSLLKIVREEGLCVDAMSPGEIYVEQLAGFEADEILYIGNNVSADEFRYAIERGVTVSVDSLSQLELVGKISPGAKVSVRFNPGVGAGHHEKVVTAGKKTKFGVMREMVSEVQQLVAQYQLRLVGINQHIGSLFMEGTAYLESVEALLQIAEQFEDLEFVDFGGGFGTPYRKLSGESALELKSFGEALSKIVSEWARSYGKEITFKIEPGRYIVAECGALLGTVHATKKNYDRKYIGTDLGFNVLMRPVLYDAHHDISIFPVDGRDVAGKEKVTVVGNICETGDIIAEERALPIIKEQDILVIHDAGAYGSVMSSNYNNRLRPAEVLIDSSGQAVLIRNRDTLEDLVRHY